MKAGHRYQPLDLVIEAQQELLGFGQPALADPQLRQRPTPPQPDGRRSVFRALLQAGKDGLGFAEPADVAQQGAVHGVAVRGENGDPLLADQSALAKWFAPRFKPRQVACAPAGDEE